MSDAVSVDTTAKAPRPTRLPAPARATTRSLALRATKDVLHSCWSSPASFRHSPGTRARTADQQRHLLPPPLRPRVPRRQLVADATPAASRRSAPTTGCRPSGCRRSRWPSWRTGSGWRAWRGCPGLLHLGLALVLWLLARRYAGPLTAAAIVAVALTAASPGLSMRPQVLSYVLIALTTAAWMRHAARTARRGGG